MPSPRISRAQFLGLSALAGLSCSTVADNQSHVAPPPNFVVIFTDDQAYSAVGFNNPLVKTPHLDALANSGVIFDRTYIASPICVASRASIMTGRFPQQHGTVALDASGFQRSVVEEKRFKTFAHHLSAAGYTTAFCGKSHLGDPKAYGFAEGMEHNDPSDAKSIAFARNFLDTRAADAPPFFLWTALRQPHIPLKPEQEWLDLYDRSTLKVDPNFREEPPAESIYNQGKPGEHYYRDSKVVNPYKNVTSGPPRSKDEIIDFLHAYYATISRLDAQVGELIGTLKATGHYENTYIIFMADNGYHVGNHGLGNKITMHEEAVHVPHFIHSPLLARAARTKSLASSTDILPTVLDLAGCAPQPDLPGKSLVPVLKKPNATVREFVASACVGVGGTTGMGHRMVRGDRWKYVLTDINEEALFDEDADPYELTNVVSLPENAAQLATMRGHMRTWMAAVGDTHTPPPA